MVIKREDERGFTYRNPLDETFHLVMTRGIIGRLVDHGNPNAEESEDQLPMVRFPISPELLAHQSRSWNVTDKDGKSLHFINLRVPSTFFEPFDNRHMPRQISHLQEFAMDVGDDFLDNVGDDFLHNVTFRPSDQELFTSVNVGEIGDADINFYDVDGLMRYPDCMTFSEYNSSSSEAASSEAGSGNCMSEEEVEEFPPVTPYEMEEEVEEWWEWSEDIQTETESLPPLLTDKESESDSDPSESVKSESNGYDADSEESESGSASVLLVESGSI